MSRRTFQVISVGAVVLAVVGLLNLAPAAAPVTPEVAKRRQELREFQLALLQASDVCKNQRPGCEGGKYGPVSPRRSETPPSYLATGAAGGGVINRSDNPEDRTLGERCMAAI